MGRSVANTAVAFLAVICGVSSAADVAAQIRKAPPTDVPATIAGIRAHYASTKSWTASFNGTRGHPSKPTPIKGTIAFHAPDDIVVTSVGGGTSKTTCANPGAMIFLCGMQPSIMTFDDRLPGFTNQPIMLVGTPANATSPMTQHFLFYVDRKTFAISRVITTSPIGGNDSDIELTNVVRK